MDIEIGGLSRLLSDIEEATQEQIGEIERMFAGAADRVYTTSQAEVPVDSGDLKASGAVTPWKYNDTTNIDISYGDGTPTPHSYSYEATETQESVEADGYAWFVELGTAKMAAQPYLGPAFEEESQDLVHQLGNMFS